MAFIDNAARLPTADDNVVHAVQYPASAYHDAGATRGHAKLDIIISIRVILDPTVKMAKDNLVKDSDLSGDQCRHGRLAIGTRLRELRQARGLSQRAVAQAAGTGHRTVATIEKDEISPSVSTLKRIVDGLGMTLSEFFDGVETCPDERVVYRASELLELADGERVSYRQVGRSLSGRNMMILHEKYSVGADTGASYTHDAQEGGIVVRGRISLTVGSEQWTLSAGDAYYFDSRKPHRFYNPFTEQCEIVSAVSPPTF